MADTHATRARRRLPTDGAARRAPRIGVALAGGGAKGAYQVGCLQALRDAGFGKVAAIAGTSVGAIHGVMLAADAVDEAERIWTKLRWSDVIRINTGRVHRLPLWCLAALNSEFSPFKVWRLSNSVTHPVWWRRWLYPVTCAASAVALVAMATLLPALRLPAVVFAAVLAVCGALAASHRWLRPHFLGSALVSHAPLASRLQEALTPDDWQRVQRTGTAIFATVSEFRPYTHEAVPWGGWVPHYARLDQKSREAAIETLMAGSSLPGFSDVPTVDGRTRIDGAWTDNVPAAPLLFDPGLDLDVALVVYLKSTVRHRHRHNSLLGVASLLLSDAIDGKRRHERDLVEWARLRWAAAGRNHTDHGRKLPLVVPVVPSRRLGNFFSGTIWFSPARARQLMEMGREDTERVLAELGLRQDGEAIRPRQVPDTRLGILRAEAEQAMS